MFYIIKSIFITALICCVSTAASNYRTTTGCLISDFAVQSNFNMSAYAGRWYEFAYKPIYFEAHMATWMDYYDQYTYDNSTGIPRLHYSYAGSDSGNNFACIGGSYGPLSSYNQSVPAKMTYMHPYKSSTTQLDYWVIGTDYVTYAVVYSCVIISNSTTCQESAIVLSRTRTMPTTTVLNIINNLLTSVCLPNISGLTAVWQNSTLCPVSTTVNKGTDLVSSNGLLLTALIIIAIRSSRLLPEIE